MTQRARSSRPREGGMVRGIHVRERAIKPSSDFASRELNQRARDFCCSPAFSFRSFSSFFRIRVRLRSDR